MINNSDKETELTEQPDNIKEPELKETTKLLVDELNIIECKFCLCEDKRENLSSPCDCSGSVKYVHPHCLQIHLDKSGRTACEICGYTFVYTNVYNESKTKCVFLLFSIFFINNLFVSLISYNFPIIVSLGLHSYLILCQYIFCKLKLYQFNILKFKKIKYADNLDEFYNLIIKKYSNHILFCFVSIILSKLINKVSDIIFKINNTVFNSWMIFMTINQLTGLYFYIKNKSVIKKIIDKK